MNLFSLATRGIDLDNLPDEEAPRQSVAFEPSSNGGKFSVPGDLNDAFEFAARDFDIDPDVLRAVAYAESRFNPDVVSGKVKSKTGATGLMQFMPATAKEYGIDPLDPVQSIFGAAAYLRKSLDRFDGDYGKAVASYNAGPNRKDFDAEDWDARMPAETQGYLRTVFTAADQLKQVGATVAKPTQATSAPDTGDETARLAARYKAPDAPQQGGFIQSVGDFFKPAPTSVLESYKPTAAEQQAANAQRLRYGAGPIKDDVLVAANEVASGNANSSSPTVNAVAKQMQERGDTFTGYAQSKNTPILKEGARDAKAAEFRSAGEWAVDSVSALAQGSVSIPLLPASILAPGGDTAKTLRSWRDAWSEQESDVLKAQRVVLKERIQSEEGFAGKYAATVLELVTNPALGLSEAIKQVPNYLAVIGASRIASGVVGASFNAIEKYSPTLALANALSSGAVKGGAQATAATAGGMAASVVMTSGDAAGDVYETLTDPNKTPKKVWEQNEDYQALIKQGLSHKAAVMQIAEAKARFAAVVVAPLGLFGFMGAESALATKGIAGLAASFGPKAAAKTFGKEIVGENIEEGGTKWGGNVVTSTVDPRVKWDEGVAEAAATATVTSAPMAGLAARSQLSAPDAAPKDQRNRLIAAGLLDPQTYDGGIVGAAGTANPLLEQLKRKPVPTVESQPTTPQVPPTVPPTAPAAPTDATTATQAVDNIAALLKQTEAQLDGTATQTTPVPAGGPAADIGTAPVDAAQQGATEGQAGTGAVDVAGQSDSAQSLSVPQKGSSVIPSVETGQSLAQRLTKPATPAQEQAQADTVVAEKAKPAPTYTPAIPQPGQADGIVSKALDSARKNADLADERLYSTDALQRIATHPNADAELKSAATTELQRRAGIEQVKQQQLDARRNGGTVLSIPDAPPLRPLSVERGMEIAKASRERKLLPQEQGYMDALKAEIGDQAFDLMTRAGKAPFMTTMAERKFDLPRLLEQNQSALADWDNAYNQSQHPTAAPQAAQTASPAPTGIGAEMDALKARSQPAVKMNIAPAMKAAQAPAAAAPVASQQITPEAPVAPVAPIAEAPAEKVVNGKKAKSSGADFSAVGTTYQWDPARITQRQKTSKGQPAVDKAGNPVMEDVYPATIDGKDVVLAGQAVDSYRKLAELDAAGVKHTPRSNADAAPSAVTGIPAYSGNKASFVQSAGHRLMNWLKGAKGDVLYDAFGGGGGYGLWVVNNAAKNVKHLVINEIDQLRSEKLQWTLEYNGKLAELYNSPTLKPIIQLMRGLEGGGSVVKAAAENARAGEVIAKPKKEYEKTNLPIFQKLAELGKKLTQEDKIAIQAIIDRAYASRAKHEDVDTIIKKSVEDSVQYHAQAVAFATRGGKISFTVHDGTDTTKIPKGSIVIADPPYLYTTGYKDSGDQELSYIEGPDFFEKSKQMLLESERMGNTVIYHNSLAALAGMRSGEKFGARYASADTVGVAAHLDDFLPFKRVSSAPVPDDFVGVKYGRFDEGAPGSRSGDAWVRAIGGRTARIGPIAGGGASQSVAQGKDGLRDAKLQVQSDTTASGIKASSAAPSGVTTVADIRTAITKAYGNLLPRLEGKGLVSLTQTEEEAIAAAAQARADQNGGDVEAIKAQMRASVLASQRAWHGTPHRGIEKFSTEKIGTGEGAQAFGWGLYFASRRELGEYYKEKLSGPDIERAVVEEYTIAGDRNWIATTYDESGEKISRSGYLDDAELIDLIGDWAFNNVLSNDTGEDADVYVGKKAGQLYEVEIPEDGDMLLWDKPLSEQPESVQNALDSAIRAPYATGKALSAAEIQRIESQWSTLTGEKLYKMLEDANLAGGSGAGTASARAASMHLASFGIKGIKYLDGTSRNAGEGSYNYVVFSGEDVQIVDVKYSKDGNLEGFFDPATGKSFLIADNLTAESAPATLMHEVGIHMAAEGKFGPMFDRALTVLNDGSLESTEALRRMQESGETSGEEAAAYLVTVYETNRTNAPASVGKWVKDFIADVRAWLFNKGVLLKADQLTVADIAAVARANASRIAKGKGWIGSAQNDGAFRFGNTDGQRSKDIATVAEAFSSDRIKLVGVDMDDGSHQVYLDGAPDQNMTVYPVASGRWRINAQDANRGIERSGDNAGQRMYQALFAWAHNNGHTVDAEFALSFPNELRRTSAMLSSALRFNTTDHLGEVDETQGIDGWKYGDFTSDVNALADAELRKVGERILSLGDFTINKTTGEVSVRTDSAVADSLYQGRQGESANSGLGESAARGIRGADVRNGAGRKDGQVGTRPDDRGVQVNESEQTGSTRGMGDGAKVSQTPVSDSELARYLASTRGGFEAHGVGVSTLKRALITRDFAGETDLPGLLYSVAGETDIRRSVRGGGQQAQQNLALNTPSPAWMLPASTKTDALVYEIQDQKVDLKRTQEAIKAAGRTITEPFDARMAETLMPGRVAYRTETFLKTEVAPLMEAMAKNNVTQNELSDYLLARHAPERNAQIAKVNPEMPDGGAGTNSAGVLMTTQAAQDHIAALTTGKRMVLQLLANKIDAITASTRDMLVREGLEKQSTMDAWTGAYKHYVPLFKDEAVESPAHPIGSGMSVTGSASKRAMGSEGEVTNMVAHILMQREAAITRAEKNRVAMSLYGLALSNPNQEVWTTIRPNMRADKIGAELAAMGVDPVEAEQGMQGVPTIRTINAVTGLVQDTPNPMYKRLENALVVKVDGEDRVVLFNAKNADAMRMARALKNQDGLTNFDLAGSMVGTATRYFASINTQYNPAFGMVNVVRDVGGALVNLSTTGIADKKAQVFGDIHAAMKGIARDVRGDQARTPWSDLWVQFQEDGGRTGYRDLFIDPFKRAEAVQKDLDAMQRDGTASAGRVAHSILDLLDDFNTTLENGVRLSAYKAALDKGMSRPAAAKMARELTTAHRSPVWC